jgi:5-methylcytosine-specific restriction endonuclease McrA
MMDAGDRTYITMRSACARCGSSGGEIIDRNGQDTVRCGGCGTFQYNAPRTETGKRQRSVTTVHNGIKPGQRARILSRATGRCELCGSRGNLHVGHILSVDAGVTYGLADAEINHDENLMALCEECNLGFGAEPMPLRVAIAVLRARIAWAAKAAK